VLLPSHCSATSHSPAAGRQIAPAFPAGWTHMPVPSHTSSVHGLASAGHGLSFVSYWHVAEQQSPSVVLPSSHCSPVCTTPLPHAGPIRKFGAKLNSELVWVGQASDEPNAMRRVCTAVRLASSETFVSVLNSGVKSMQCMTAPMRKV